jgi:hypothetical protein
MKTKPRLQQHLRKSMNREHPAGKGDSPRKVDGDAYRQNHDAIFQKALLEVCLLCGDCDCMEDRDFNSHDETTYYEKP